jgi:predicted nucleotidyltransferase
MNASEILRGNRDDILRIAGQYGATNVRVFGSVARGEADADSDIDLLVTFESGRSLMDHAGLQIELEKLVGIRVEVASDKGLKSRIRNRVLAEAVNL